MGTPRNLNDRFNPAGEPKPRDRQVLRASSHKKPTVLTGLVAFADVILAVAANKFFDGAAWVIAVVTAGLAFVALTVLNVREENGERIISWTRIHRIVTARIFVAVISAAVAGAGTYLVMNRVATRNIASPPASPTTISPTTAPTRDASNPPTPQPNSPTAITTTTREPHPTRPSIDRCETKPGMTPVKRQAGAPQLTFCPALLNNGAPLEGPFTAVGRILGREQLFSKLVIVNRANPDTCDAYGNPPDSGYYYARGMTIDTDGKWEFHDGLGYDEAVTIGRTYSFVTGPADALDAIRTDREVHGPEGYTGMPALPAKAQIVATFYQAPGKYHGKGSPSCKNG
jgi:hypothetical protein